MSLFTVHLMVKNNCGMRGIRVDESTTDFPNTLPCDVVFYPPYMHSNWTPGPFTLSIWTPGKTEL